MKCNKISYSKQTIAQEDIDAVIEALKSDFITRGPKSEEFENKLAKHCGAKYAVVFNSGTSALYAAYLAAGLKKQSDELITTPNTFAATANMAIALGAEVTFADIEKDTGNIDISQIEKLITQKTKAIVPVHFAGHPVDLEHLHTIAQKRDIVIIEDACHALGAKYKGTQDNEWNNIGCCQYSDMTVFSFHPVKTITTGEGGAVLTNNENFRDKLINCRQHGITKNPHQFIRKENSKKWFYEMQTLGFNFILTDFQAALGISQLNKIDSFIEKRRQIAKTYDCAFAQNPNFTTVKEKNYAKSARHLYYILLNDENKSNRNNLFNRLNEHGVGVGVHYIPVYKHPYYKSIGYENGLCPICEDFYEKEITIPLYPSMTDEDVNFVIEQVSNVFAQT
ncbi:spore coat protein [Candidatus Magnetoovum chiemensis]|nr:spore coat protein [Candidatus Magnetoovum chiemensis]